MLDLRILKDGSELTPEALAEAIADAQVYQQLGDAIEGMIGLLDAMQGDLDLEETGTEDGFVDHEANGPGCPIADPGGCEHDGCEPDDDARDVAWIERIDQGRPPLPRMRAEQKDDDGTGHAIGNVEDLEEDDFGEQEDDRCSAGDDGVFSGAVVFQAIDRWPGHEIGDDVDAEREQMIDDVPMPSTVSLEPNIFTGKRENLGITNMQSSFRTNGNKVQSADSGRPYRSTGWIERGAEGKPV